MFRDPDSGRNANRYPADDQTLDELFELVEAALHAGAALSATAADGPSRTLEAVWNRLEAELEAERAASTVGKTRDLCPGRSGLVLPSQAGWQTLIS